MLLIFGLVLFVLLVIVHEYGHYKAARKAGVEVEEFGLGFPPRVWGKRLKSKMLLSINALPLGGFVKLKGEHDADTTKGSYGAASLGNKVKIMLAGVFLNLLVAVGLLTILSWVGMPQLVENQFNIASDSKINEQKVLVAQVEENSPAASAVIKSDNENLNQLGKKGLQRGDELVSISGECLQRGLAEGDCVSNINTPEDLVDATKQFASGNVQITIIRGGEEMYASADLRSDQEVEAAKDTDNPKGYLGVVPTEYQLRQSTWSAPIVAVGTTVQYTKLTLQGLGSALANLFQGQGGKAADQVSGPVGIFVVIKDGSILGYEFILMIIAVISLTLAIMNSLPIPALDGGRLAVTLVYRALKKPLTKEAEEKIHGLGFAALLGLFVLITIVDVRRFF